MTATPEDTLSPEQIRILEAYGAETPRALIVGLCDALGNKDSSIVDHHARKQEANIAEDFYETGIQPPANIDDPRAWAEEVLPVILPYFANDIETHFPGDDEPSKGNNFRNSPYIDHRELFILAKYAPQMIEELARQGELSCSAAMVLAPRFPATITETVLLSLPASHIYDNLGYFAQYTPNAVTEKLLLEVNKYYHIHDQFPAVHHYARHAVTEKLCEEAGTSLEAVRKQAEEMNKNPPSYEPY